MCPDCLSRVWVKIKDAVVEDTKDKQKEKEKERGGGEKGTTVQQRHLDTVSDEVDGHHDNPSSFIMTWCDVTITCVF